MKGSYLLLHEQMMKLWVELERNGHIAWHTPSLSSRMRMACIILLIDPLPWRIDQRFSDPFIKGFQCNIETYTVILVVF